jgi:glycerol-3-phosphate dehydrogenase subunit B
MRSPDVLVIGGGIAGCSAALAAAEAGARVCLVRRAPGATALAAGAWYGSPPPQLRAALAAVDYELVQPTHPLPHVDGRLLPADWTTPSHAAAAVHESGTTLVCGISGVAWFRPAALARLWAGGAPALQHVTITLDETPPAGWSTAALASALDREPALLLAALQRSRDAVSGRHLVLPAVLGMFDHARVVQDLADAGVVAAEALGGSPSLPGWRLDSALQRALDNAGVQGLHGAARATTGGSGYDVVIEASTSTLRPGAIVLATGGFVGGGVQATPAFAEPACALPVHAQAAARQFDSATDAIPLTNLDRMAPQPLLEAGVMDAPAGIFIAGAVRAGVETAALGLGDAATDGWQAGLAAAAAAGVAASDGSGTWR